MSDIADNPLANAFAVVIGVGLAIFALCMLLAPAIILVVCCIPIMVKLSMARAAPEQPAMWRGALWAFGLMMAFVFVVQMVQPIYYYAANFWDHATYTKWKQIQDNRRFVWSALSDRIVNATAWQIGLTAFFAYYLSRQGAKSLGRRVAEGAVFLAIGVLGHAIIMGESIAQWISEARLMQVPVAVSAEVGRDIAETVELILKCFYSPSEVLAWGHARYVGSNGELPLLMRHVPKGMWIVALAAAVSWSR